MAEIPDTDLSHVGVTKYGDFSVEVIDAVSDYLELMEVRVYIYIYTHKLLLFFFLMIFGHEISPWSSVQDVFDFDLIRGLLSRSDFGYVLTSTASYVMSSLLGVDVAIICTASRFMFDAMHAVTGAYAKPIFVDNLGAKPVCNLEI